MELERKNVGYLIGAIMVVLGIRIACWAIMGGAVVTLAGLFLPVAAVKAVKTIFITSAVLMEIGGSAKKISTSE